MDEQERASTQASLAEELRHSIEAGSAERVKEEKLKLSRKALELGKQKVRCYFLASPDSPKHKLCMNTDLTLRVCSMGFQLGGDSLLQGKIWQLS